MVQEESFKTLRGSKGQRRGSRGPRGKEQVAALLVAHSSVPAETLALVESLGFVTIDEARDTITLLRAG